MCSWVVRKIVWNWGKTVDFPFYGPYLWCCYLVLEVCFACQCDFFRWKMFPTFLILLSCPLQWKIYPLTTLWWTSHPIVSVAGKSATNFTLTLVPWTMWEENADVCGLYWRKLMGVSIWGWGSLRSSGAWGCFCWRVLRYSLLGLTNELLADKVCEEHLNLWYWSQITEILR